MRSAIASFLCFVTTACGSGVIEGGPFEVLDEGAFESSSPIAAASKEEILALGDTFLAALPTDWRRQEGEWRLADIENCFEPGGMCFGNNPSSPYGYPAFGEPGSGVVDSVFQWDRDEAVVLFMRTPPRARYFAFTQYLFQVAHASRPAFASLSDSLNLSDFRTQGSAAPGDDVFEQPAVLVWAANMNTVTTVKATLAGMGFPESQVNFLPMPAAVPSFTPAQGYGEDSDTFTMLMRIALPDSQSALDAYLEEKPFAVLKVGPPQAIAFAAAPVIGYANELTGVSETTLSPNQQSALNALVTDIRTRYAGTFSFTKQTVDYKSKTGWDCLAGTETCAGDNHDALYSADGATVLVRNLRDAVLIAGVNHVKTGKTAYQNHAIYELEHMGGVAAISDPVLTTASALYHAGVAPGTLKAARYKNLYAYLVSFDCAGLSHCLQIPQPTPDNPVGIPAGKPFIVAGRSYLEPRSGVRPDPSELIAHQVWLGRK